MTELTTDRWQLPDGVEELLPDAAWRVERLRRRIMDCCHRWGFELVMPPIIEYVDSLLTGTGETMDTQTFKFIDQHNGKMLGIRADMTPQVARMDAHSLRQDIPNRLFYVGTVLRALTDGFGGSRSPQQFGAELFGHAGAEADIEVIRLMLDTVSLASIREQELLIDLGHVGVYRHLIASAGLNARQEGQLRSALHRGSRPDADALLGEFRQSLTGAASALQRIAELLDLQGDAGVLDIARERLAGAGKPVDEALDTLSSVIAALRVSHPDLSIHIDLSELRGYRYHTGTLFGLYAPGGEELANGGRYDDVGAAFGRARPATGFSGDLKQLACLKAAEPAVEAGIFVAAHAEQIGLLDRIAALRAEGERVVVALPGANMTAAAVNCNRELVRQGEHWQVRSLIDESTSSIQKLG